VIAIGTVAMVIFSTRSSLADHYVVPSGSMLPTVEIGDRILVNKLAFGFHLPFVRSYLIPIAEPQRGDVVVLDSPVEDIVLLKRVVAVPGDRVEVREGRLSIGGREVPVAKRGGQLTEVLDAAAHPIRVTHGGGPSFGPMVVPEGHYLVLGDNRGESADGRLFGFVERDRLRGKAIAVYYSDGGFTWERL
jgi:signal peptidase I